MTDLAELCTTAQAADALGVDPAHVRRLAREGTLVAIRLSPRVILITRESVRAYNWRRASGNPLTPKSV